MNTIRTRRGGLSDSSQLELCLPATSIGATFATCNQATSRATSARIFSPASAVGRSRCAASDGATTDLFGPLHSRAKETRAQESASDSMTPGTSGPTSKSSSRHDALQSSLENSLRTYLRGSSLCEVIWIDWNTPWGQCLSKPHARVRSTAGLDTTLWPTPTTSRGGSNNNSKSVRQKGHGTNLVGAVKASLWGTPRVTDNGGRSTANAPDKSRLEDQVVTTDWNGSGTLTVKSGAVHPEFVAWLMGYPDAWLWTAPPAKN